MKEKLKYLIIFILVLVSILFYIQIRDYNSVTSILIQDNKSNQKINKNLKFELDRAKKIVVSQQNEIDQLKQQINKMDSTIISLEENLSKLTIYKTLCNNNSINYQTNQIFNNNDLLLDQNSTIDQIDNQEQNGTKIIPTIQLSDENKITGFGLQYQQKF